MNAPFQITEETLPWKNTFEQWFSLSQTQRRLSHRSRHEAAKYEASNYQTYAYFMSESRRLWRDAKYHLSMARRERNLHND